jgi:hypothetical protein
MTHTTIIETLAAVCGLAGTLLLAMRGPRAGWGFVLYLVSNAGWICFAVAGDHLALLVQQIGFTATSAYGAYVWLARDRGPKANRPRLFIGHYAVARTYAGRFAAVRIAWLLSRAPLPTAPSERTMTKQEFIDGYCARTNIPWERLSLRRVALPCGCGEEGCEGWAMIPNDPQSMAHHQRKHPTRTGEQ